jgi:hypothetical protein
MSLHPSLDSTKHSPSQTVYSTRWNPLATASSFLRQPRTSHVPTSTNMSNYPNPKAVTSPITTITCGRRNAPPSFMLARSRLASL